MSERFQIPLPIKGPFTLGPDSQRKNGVPRGTVTKHEWKSEIFPGTHRDFWVYVPAQYSPKKPANVMFFQDGGSYVDENGRVRVPVVFDNLIHEKRMPVTVAILVNPGYFPATGPDKKPVSNRSFEYDSLSNQYVRFLLEEILPEVSKSYKLTDQASGRAICGASSGGICSWTAAWERPDAISKVLSHVGSFQDIRGGHVVSNVIRKAPKKDIRCFLQAGSNDLENPHGSWPLSNLMMAASLHFMGYEYKLEFGDGAHDYIHGGAIFPQSLEWLWAHVSEKKAAPRKKAKK